MSEPPCKLQPIASFKEVQECTAMEILLFKDSKQSNSKAECDGCFTCHQAVVQPNDYTKLANLLLEV